MADFFIQITVSTPYDTDEYPVEYRILDADRGVLYDWQESSLFDKPDTDEHPVIYVQARQQLDNDIMCINEKEFELVPQPIPMGSGNVYAVTSLELHAFTLNYISESEVVSEYGWEMELEDVFGNNVDVNEMISHEGMLFIAGQMSSEGFIGAIDPGGNVIWQQSYSERIRCVGIVVYDDILWASFRTEGYNGRISKIDLQTGVEDDGVMLSHPESDRSVNPGCFHVGPSGVYAAGADTSLSSTVDSPFWRLGHNLEEVWNSYYGFYGGIASLGVDDNGGRLLLSARVGSVSYAHHRVYRIFSAETGDHIVDGPDDVGDRSQQVLFYQDKWVLPLDRGGGVILVEPGGDPILEENFDGPEGTRRLTLDMQGNVLFGNSTRNNSEGPTYFPVYDVAAEELVDMAIRPEFEDRSIHALAVVGAEEIADWSDIRMRAEAQWFAGVEASAGQISLDPTHELDFGEVEDGDDVVKTVEITNTGGEPISVSVELIESAGGAFSVISGLGSFTLDGGESWQVVVRYTAQTGPANGMLEISHDAGNMDDPIEYWLRGQGV